jgi:hypothetical protein
MELMWQIIMGYNSQTVWLLHIACNLGEEAICRQSDRTAHIPAHPHAYRLLNLPAQDNGLGNLLLPTGQTAGHFVNRMDLLDRYDSVYSREYLLMKLDVNVWPSLDHLQIRAKLAGDSHLGAGLDAVAFGFIASGNAAGTINHHRGNCHRAVAQPRLKLLFDRRKIRIHIEKEPT